MSIVIDWKEERAGIAECECGGTETRHPKLMSLTVHSAADIYASWSSDSRPDPVLILRCSCSRQPDPEKEDGRKRKGKEKISGDSYCGLLLVSLRLHSSHFAVCCFDLFFPFSCFSSKNAKLTGRGYNAFLPFLLSRVNH